MKKIILLIFVILLCSCTAEKVTEEPFKLEVDIEEKNLSLIDAKGPYQLTYSNNLTDLTDHVVSWTSSNEEICTVKDGVITPIYPGKCHINYKVDNKGDTVYVEVRHFEYYGESPTYENSEGLTFFGDILVANKTYDLPEDFDPGLHPLCEKAFNAMKEAAAKEGLNLFILSGYRSYDYQDKLYHKYVREHGQASADTFSARPGHSEHQTGLALDVNLIDYRFADTPEGKWLAENCYKYGFIIRYQKEKEAITGYIYEPWHIRYLGSENALKVYESGLSLEEYLNIDSKYAE